MQGAEPQLPDGVNLGEVFADRYRLDAIIGRGAMGVVVSAHDRRLDTQVAIKLLLAVAPDRSEAGARFVREGRAAARLRSQHVVRVWDIAVHHSGLPYIVMDRLTGSDMAKVLRNAGPLPIEIAVDYVLEACEAVDEAHRRGIVHRDLKPANLFLADREVGRPIIKVLDFGVAKVLLSGRDTIDVDSSLMGKPAETEKRAILGSPFYMSPEQMESSGDVDTRTDIWSLGITLYELVAGEPPYTGPSLVHVYSRMTAPGEHPWKGHLARIAPALLPIVAKCLERDRDARYASVAELAAALAPLGSSRARDSEQRIRTAPSKTPGDPIERLTLPSVVPSSVPAAASTVRFRGRWTGVALIALMAGLGALVWRGRSTVMGVAVVAPVSLGPSLPIPGPPATAVSPTPAPPASTTPSVDTTATTSPQTAPPTTAATKMPPQKHQTPPDGGSPVRQEADAGAPSAKKLVLDDLLNGPI
jgi:serine/threonine protein kinase